MSEQSAENTTSAEKPEAPLPTFEAPAPGQALARADEPGGSISAFASAANYETARKMASALAASGIVPAAYQGKPANCIVAMELAGRTGASVFAVMQNLHIIQGKPSFSSAFLIGSVNSCGRFTPLRFEVVGETSKPGWKCRAIAKDIKTGDVLDGVWVTWEMAQAEGWTTKTGSKWKTMAELMIRYRAAAFWTRIYAPEISLGMHTVDEVEDFVGPAGPSAGAVDLNKALGAVATVAQDVVVEAEVESPTAKCPICFRTDGTHDPEAPCADEPVRSKK